MRPRQSSSGSGPGIPEALRHAAPAEIRARIRAGELSGHTAGMAPGHLQGNVAILPGELAEDFFRFCQRNPKPCPLVGVSDRGDPGLPTLGTDIDIRTDLGGYNVFRDGKLVEQREQIADLWRDDFVTFVLGCSFSFEEALMAEGIRLRHIEQDRTVSMYRTSIQTVPAGPFSGEMVVSMRPMTTRDAIRAVQITGRFPEAHGTPVHLGDPAEIGIRDISRPDWGDPTEFRPGEIPVFWACGVTPQVAVRNARPPVCITHSPGRMLVTDIPVHAAADRMT